MAVFFVHDPAKGIVTPLDKRYFQRDIPPTSALTAAAPAHRKVSNEDATDTYTSLGSKHRAAKQAYAQTLRQSPLKLGKVRDVMSSPVITVSSEEHLSDAWALMQRHEIRHLAIIDPHGHLCGMLSEQVLLPDLMTRTLNPEADEANNPQLKTYCQYRLLSTSPDTELVELAEAMLEQGLDGMPVTEQGKLVGMVTDSDILKVILKSRPVDLQA
ncbi:MAG: CBS domain-containing protein [Oleiphilaceae bacterium]|nr:CBS domain-containing protein [Oleiphilaceae bacterium]